LALALSLVGFIRGVGRRYCSLIIATIYDGHATLSSFTQFDHIKASY